MVLADPAGPSVGLGESFVQSGPQFVDGGIIACVEESVLRICHGMAEAFKAREMSGSRSVDVFGMVKNVLAG